jgi:GDP-L-fucose synthase
VVVLAAAKVGGMQANNSYPADFLLENLKIQTNVIETAWRSSCIYPKIAEQPIREDALLTGPLEPTNSHVLPPLREFLHVDDLGEACVFALENWQPGPDEQQFLNVGTGVDLSIRELAEAAPRRNSWRRDCAAPWPSSANSSASGW